MSAALCNRCLKGPAPHWLVQDDSAICSFGLVSGRIGHSECRGRHFRRSECALGRIRTCAAHHSETSLNQRKVAETTYLTEEFGRTNHQVAGHLDTLNWHVSGTEVCHSGVSREGGRGSVSNSKGTRRGFGCIRKLPSDRYQARYTGPDGETYKAARTFASSDDAVGWLNSERKRIDLGVWTPPNDRSTADGMAAGAVTLGDYAERWYKETDGRHKPRYRKLNRGYLDRQILPKLSDTPLTQLTAQDVRSWFASLDSRYPTRNANAYSLLRTILNQAVDDELLQVNPCRIKGAASKHRVREPIALSADEVRTLADAMPKKWRALVLVAGFSGLRWGELTALRRRDIDLTGGGATVSVRRAVVRVKGGWVVGRPKSKAALRTVPLPDPLRSILVDHMKAYSGSGPTGLVFPAEVSEYLHRDNVREALKRAGKKIGHENIVPHDLRHTAATLFAEAGATLADHMTLMGHTSAAMSARYTHSTSGRTRNLVQSTWGTA